MPKFIGGLKTIASVVVGLGLIVSPQFGAAAERSIRIGSFLTTSGPAAYLGEPAKKTMEAEIGRINAGGGLLGRQLELVLYDDGGAADRAVGLAKRLLDNDNVDVLIGGSTTATSMAVAPLAEKTGMPFISFGGAGVIVNPVRKWVFKVPHSDRMAAEKVFVDLKRRGLTKVALLSEDSGFGKAGRDQILNAAPAYGIQIVADEIYGAKDTDTTVQLTKIRGNPQAQALLVWGFGSGAVIAVKNYRQLDMRLPMYQSHGVASKEFVKVTGAAGEGVRIPAAAGIVADKVPAEDRQKSVVMDYQHRYETQYKEPVSAFGVNAFDGVLLYIEAVKRAGSFDKEKVRDALERTRDLVGANGTFNMSEKDHNGLSFESLRLLEIEKGDWKIVD
ncbi:ABC transporter substrate-binding protein [Bradyrhizobium mercantei]|uniref:ABC transporter substrate-binding protein n=1 Tax=Bradyrhizobium mercantei TaxID=1904807 RepID=UPI000976DEB3|nr:ABC transporter substrate-binding protein [Bradyrhizobium mercantei]